MTFIPNVYGIISSENSTSTSIAPSETFIGSVIDVSDYNVISCSILSDQNSADKGMKLQFSTDGTNWDISYNRTVYAGKACQISAPVAEKFFKIVYANGPSVASVRLQTILGNGKECMQTETTADGSQIVFSKTKIGGSMISKSEPFKEIKVSPSGELMAKISSPSTAFGELSVQSHTLFDNLLFLYSINPLNTKITNIGTGTITKIGIFAVLSTGILPSSKAQILSVKNMSYSPGIGIMVRFTCIFGTPLAGTKMLIGYGTDLNGLFFGYEGTSFGIFKRSGGVDEFIPQSLWNEDKFDGTGNSEVSLDTTKGNVFMIDFQWLGFGALNFYIESPVDGAFSLVHQIKYANTSTVTSLESPNGYLYASVYNQLTINNVQMNVSCMALYYQGSIPRYVGNRWSVDTTATVAASLNQHIMSIRNNSTYQTVQNFINIGLLLTSFATAGNKSVKFSFVLNATLTLAVWNPVSSGLSVADFATNVFTVSGGQNVFSYILNATDSKDLDLFSLNYDLFPGNTLSIVCFTTNGTNSNSVSLSWIERT